MLNASLPSARLNMSTAAATLLSAVIVAGLVTSAVSTPASATVATQSGTDESFDRVLNLYVRDGLVYYAALRVTDRTRIDQYVDARRAAPPGFEGWSPSRQLAFWINSYNAIVLKTVLDHYPIRGSSPLYPTNSIRQIGGAFDRTSHQIAGRRLTLDEIEQSVLASFEDPRVFLALGRGAVGSGRLRSETYSGATLDLQLAAVVEEFATEPWGVVLDRLGAVVQVNPIFGWRESEFVAAYADHGWTDSGRTPLERAILNLIEPVLFPSERVFLAKNMFSLGYQEFDWRLNDLTGGRP